MHLLQSGVPFNVIALWLGHESMNTTHRYVEANLAMKEKALARLEAPDTKMGRYRHRTRCCGSCNRCNYARYAGPNASSLQGPASAMSGPPCIVGTCA